ncbi:aminoacyl-histidine dipeptidase [Aminipila butyrica]|uniref:Cytosol non-specific dipeptidase n=1 Tax=Aminipila butyrica TaxID=433296 RepID=A0A858BUF7_9FIRM|nr:aminoacyl-histidine dipeptidase [Aminipila butyrica]QIB68982.1 aminoacyl-histidine dipeptidase [Aminipila butyrica]
MGVLNNLKPESVFRYFEELCSIPHGSGHMDPIADYCVAFATAHNLEYYRDDLSNIIIVKNASKGYEQAPAIMLQGHLDMVCEKTAESTIDFLKDGLTLAIDGDFLYAEGTTLGGDNGIAIAMALAILDDDTLEHPRLEAIFTVDEETGLYGAEAIDVSMLQGKKLINLDSEEEGILTVSCAGGVTAEGLLPVKRQQSEGIQLKIQLSGLLGGHSGVEIDKMRGNANILMGRFLYTLNKEVNIQLIDIAGGQADNAIPRLTVLNILVAEGDVDKVKALAADYEHTLNNEYKTSDPEMKVTVENLGKISTAVFSKDSQEKTIVLLLALPNGIQAMSADIEGLVETSLNLGVLKVQEEGVALVSAVRSSIETAKKAVCDRISALMESLGGSVEFVGAYPGWEFKKDSPLRETVIRVFEKQYGKKPVIEAIHAGLECGFFAEKVEDIDCISLGPDMSGVHTVEERLSIPSVERTWVLLLEILKESK